MNWAQIPPLNALRAFSVLAETGSYTAAGMALNVTHAAIMQQVRGLEKHLETQLVRRAGRKIVLTEDGEALARELEAGFRHIRRGVETLTDQGLSRPVQVTMSPAFAVRWLMPRLSDFQSRYPDITLLLNPSGRKLDMSPGKSDVALRYCHSSDMPEGADVLLTGSLAVVGVSELLGPERISTPRDLVTLPWLQELGTNEVAFCLERLGVTDAMPQSISHMPGNLILDAVLRGDGVTYTLPLWHQEALASGKLVARFVEPDAGGFYIHTRPGFQRPPVRRFIQWLRQQGADLKTSTIVISCDDPKPDQR